MAVGVGVAFGESSPPAAGASVRGDGFAAGLSAPGLVGLAGVLVFFFGAFFLHGLAFAAWVLAAGHLTGLASWTGAPPIPAMASRMASQLT